MLCLLFQFSRGKLIQSMDIDCAEVVCSKKTYFNKTYGLKFGDSIKAASASETILQGDRQYISKILANLGQIYFYFQLSVFHKFIRQKVKSDKINRLKTWKSIDVMLKSTYMLLGWDLRVQRVGDVFKVECDTTRLFSRPYPESIDW